MRYSALAALLAGLLLGCQERPAHRDVSTSAPAHGSPDIPLGKLGPALGTILTIEGVRIVDLRKAPPSLCLVLVDAVNGKKLASPIKIDVENLEERNLPVGKRCVLRGYETGRMVGVPMEVARMKAAEAGMKADLVQIPRWEFQRTFAVVSIEAIK